jgi:hypothetical protein
VTGTPRPNLVVIGAMRCGTTSLHALLGRHPEVFMSAIKGAGLFLDPDEPIAYPSKYRSTAEKRRFLPDDALLAAMAEGHRGEPVFGESTDLYARHPVAGRGVPERMLRFEPRMRIVYIVRDPVDRIVSQHRFERRKPYRPAGASLAAYVRGPADPIAGSRYHTQLRRFLRAGFAPGRIHVLVLEELLASPAPVLERLARFLGVGPWPARALRRPLPHLNRSAVAMPPPTLAARRRLAGVLEPEVRALEAWLGRRLPFPSTAPLPARPTCAPGGAFRAAGASRR